MGQKNTVMKARKYFEFTVNEDTYPALAPS